MIRKKKFKPPAPLDIRLTKPNESADNLMDRFAGRYQDRFVTVEVKHWLSTGNVMLDCAISGGLGIPNGMWSVFRGPDGGAKSLTGLLVGAIAQMMGGSFLDLDAEARRTKGLMSLCHVDTSASSYRCLRPLTLQDALQMLTDFYSDCLCFPKGEREVPRVVLLDSLSNLNPDPTKDDKKKGARATKKPMNTPSVMTDWLKREELKLIRDYPIFTIICNQVRDEVDMGPQARFKGKRWRDPGGWALRHQTATRIDVEEVGLGDVLEKSEAEQIDPNFPPGKLIQYKITKNTVGPPHRIAHLPWFFHRGADELRGVWYWMKAYGYITHQSSGKYAIAGIEGAATPKEWLEYMYSDSTAAQYFKELFKYYYNQHSTYQHSESLR